MRRSRLAVLVLALPLTACSGERYEPERAALAACTARVEQRAGVQPEAGVDDGGWRITNRTEGARLVASFWTDVARAAPAPAGVPDYVCEATLERSADDPSVVVEVRP